jgi:hypothetical protein
VNRWSFETFSVGRSFDHDGQGEADIEGKAEQPSKVMLVQKRTLVGVA